MFDSGFVYRGEKTGWLAPLVGDHYSLVIGRQWNPQRGRCEYLVKDSFGDDCRQYKSSQVRCVCQNPSENGSTCHRGTGTYWVDEGLLQQMATSATAFM